MKPSERIKKMFDESEERYAKFDIDTRKIATLLNMMNAIEQILDEQAAEIKELRENQQRCFCEQCKADRS